MSKDILVEKSDDLFKRIYRRISYVIADDVSEITHGNLPKIIVGEEALEKFLEEIQKKVLKKSPEVFQ